MRYSVLPLLMIVSFLSNAQNQCPQLTTSTLDNGVKITTMDYEPSVESEFLRLTFEVRHGEYDAYQLYINSDSDFNLITDDSKRFFFMDGPYFDNAKEYEVVLRDFTDPNKATKICVATGNEAKSIIAQIR